MHCRRVIFFAESLRLRRRERHLWGDTPLAKVFTIQEEWHLLHARAKLEQVNREIRAKRIDMSDMFKKFDLDNDGKLSFDEAQRCFESLKLGFSPGDIIEVIHLADQEGDG